MLLYLKCYKNSLPKGVNILLGQPVVRSYYNHQAFKRNTITKYTIVVCNLFNSACQWFWKWSADKGTHMCTLNETTYMTGWTFNHS